MIAPKTLARLSAELILPVVPFEEWVITKSSLFCEITILKLVCVVEFTVMDFLTPLVCFWPSSLVLVLEWDKMGAQIMH